MTNYSLSILHRIVRNTEIECTADGNALYLKESEATVVTCSLKIGHFIPISIQVNTGQSSRLVVHVTYNICIVSLYYISINLRHRIKPNEIKLIVYLSLTNLQEARNKNTQLM